MSFAVTDYAKPLFRKPDVVRLDTGRLGHLHAHATGQEIVHEAVFLAEQLLAQLSLYRQPRIVTAQNGSYQLLFRNRDNWNPHHTHDRCVQYRHSPTCSKTVKLTSCKRRRN